MVNWRWVGNLDENEPPVERTFHSQEEAETWLGEFYPILTEQGIRAVSLYEGDRLAYGPMSLEPER